MDSFTGSRPSSSIEAVVRGWYNGVEGRFVGECNLSLCYAHYDPAHPTAINAPSHPHESSHRSSLGMVFGV